MLALALALGAPVRAEPVVIAALGDSLTQGYGLPVEDGFVPQLETWLRGQGAEVRVVNAGVSGDTTAGGLSRVGWTLTPDVNLMIVALGGNDLLRGIDPANSRANLQGILEAAKAAQVRTILVGMQAPANYGPDYKRDFDAIYPELAAQFDAVLIDGFLDALGDDLDGARDLMQADGIHPNRAGVALIVGAMGPVILEALPQ